jgi:tricarballylate dehydrogenase
VTTWDVVVVGGGNAALCAALSAADAGARVLLLERAAAAFRGGNTRHTRNIRTVQPGADGYVTGEYTGEELYSDIVDVTAGECDPGLTRLLVDESRTLTAWMWDHGVRWQRPLKGTLHLSRTNRFFLGGGKSMVNAYYETARRNRIEVRYEADVVDLEVVDGRCRGVVVREQGVETVERARAVVVASGGFEANLEWMREYWGDAADNFVVRGTRNNDGSMLRVLFGLGAEPHGDPKRFHSIAVDARSPKFDGGIVTRLDAIPLGITVNRHGQRFYDEGEDLWPKRYAIWGRLIAEQDGQIAYAIVDAAAAGDFMPSVYPPITAPSVDELAGKIDVDPGALGATIGTYNAAVTPGTFDLSQKDDCRTAGIDPPKSHWARRIERPPFYAYPLRPGITFTYHGVRVDETGRIQTRSGRFDNIFAAGEIMAGTILTRGYLAGLGLTIGSVFGRLAGREAAGCSMSDS